MRLWSGLKKIQWGDFLFLNEHLHAVLGVEVELLVQTPKKALVG